MTIMTNTQNNSVRINNKEGCPNNCFIFITLAYKI